MFLHRQETYMGRASGMLGIGVKALYTDYIHENQALTSEVRPHL